MKYYRIYLAVIMLVLASLACQSAGGGSENTPMAAPTSDTGPATQEPAPATAEPAVTAAATIETDFPMTADAYNVTEVAGTLTFFTKLSMEDAMAFYRTEYTAKGYTEREILTVASDGIFSMVFDGDPGGKAVVIQSVDLGDGSRTITIRLEDV